MYWILLYLEILLSVEEQSLKNTIVFNVNE